MGQYWFARKFPVEQVGNNLMVPVSSRGWAVVALLGGCLVAGAVGLLLFSFAYRQPFAGVLTFAGFLFVGAVAFITLVNLKGDKAHTVDDYKAGRVRW